MHTKQRAGGKESKSIREKVESDERCWKKIITEHKRKLGLCVANTAEGKAYSTSITGGVLHAGDMNCYTCYFGT